MENWQAIVLGAIQGITEFLPISSSGHLVILRHFFHISIKGGTVEIFLHFGTLLSIVTVFNREIWQMIKEVSVAFFRMVHNLSLKQPGGMNDSLIMSLYIIIGTIPAALLGLGFHDKMLGLFDNPESSFGALIVTGIILLSTFRVTNPTGSLTLLRVVVIGCAQALALVPGISRSGSTIAAGLLQGVRQNEAAYFSFYLALPAITGAVLVQSLEMLSESAAMDFSTALIIGTLTAYITGCIAIKMLLNVIRRRKFYLFGFYCLFVGIIGLIVI